MLPNVTITAAADKFMRRIVRFSGLTEQVLEVDGLRLFLAAESRMLLDGVTIDFVDTPTQSGLTFVNPNQAPCACSSSGPVEPGVAKIGIDAIGRGRPPALS